MVQEEIRKPLSLQDRLSTFWAMVRKELIVISRYPVQFVASFGQIFFIVAIFTLAGLTFSRQGVGGSGDIYDGVVIYGFVMFIFLSDTLWTIGYNIRHEQVQGTLEQLYLTPANKFTNLVSRVANLLIWSGLLSVVGLLIMASMLGSLPLKNPLLGMYLLVFSLSGTFGLGFAFAALTLRIKEAAQTMANLLQFAFLILCAMFFPFYVLPDFVIMISRLIPVSYGVDAFRSTLMGFPPGFPELAPINVEITIVTAFGVIMPILGYYLYSRAERHARQTGSLSAF